jgi:hypothetical protein
MPPPLHRATLKQSLLALAPALYLLLNATGVWEHLFGLGSVHLWIETFGLLWLCTALVAVGYALERRLAVWSLPALGLALYVLSVSAGTALVLFPLGALLVVVAFAAAFERPLAGRSWELWLVALVTIGAVIIPLLVPISPGPPVEPANALVRLFTAVLRLPQNALAVGGIFGVFSIVFAWRLAPRMGFLAGLLPVGNLLYVWHGIGDPAYALGMFTENRALVGFMELLAALTFVVVIIAVLSARGPRAQLAAFLLPIGAGLLTETVVDVTVRPHAALDHSLVVGLMFYLLPLVIALWMCSRRPALPPAPPATVI